MKKSNLALFLLILIANFICVTVFAQKINPAVIPLPAPATINFNINHIS